MNTRRFFPSMFLGGMLFSGCMTAPAPQGQTYSASYIGDRESVALDEIVLTVSLGQSSTADLRNLHVRLDAVVNPKDLALASIYEVAGIIHRLEPRIRARISDLVPVGKPLTIESLPSLKQEIAREAHTAFAASYAKWTKAPAFEVQVVVASFYLTDLSVGAPAKARSWW